tara:strand:- start:50 stop:487 length:438 start_codon:yes stop_codon:yes gene_type:complete
MAFKIPKTTLICIAIVIAVLVGLYFAGFLNKDKLPKFLQENYKDEKYGGGMLKQIVADEKKKKQKKLRDEYFDRMNEKSAKSGSIYETIKDKTSYECAAICDKDKKCRGFQRSKGLNKELSSCKLSNKSGTSTNPDRYFYKKMSP